MLNIAIVGCGGMGSGHATAIADGTGRPNFQLLGAPSEMVEIMNRDLDKTYSNASDISNELSLAGIYDIDPLRQEWASDLGYKTYGSFEEVLSDESVDIVLIATPNDLHCEQSIAALKAGKHVLCEKPVTPTSAELEKIIKVSKETGKVFYPRQNRRWDKDFLIIKEIFDKKLVGNVFEIESRIMGSRGIPGDWRSKKEHGGGMMLDWGVHLLDRLLTLLPEKIAYVFCSLSHITNEEVDDGFKMHLTFDGGLKMLIEVATCHFISLPQWYIAGTDGTGSVKDWNCDGEMVRVKTWEDKDTKPILAGEGLTKTMAPRMDDSSEKLPLPDVEYDANELYRNVADTINNKAEQIVKPEEALRVLKLIEAAFESAKNHKVVQFE